MDKFFERFICFLFGTLAGFFAYNFTLNYLEVEFSKKIDFSINPLEIFSLGITIYLAVYVLRKLNRDDEGRKIERDIAIGYFSSFEEDLIKVIKELSTDGTKYKRAVALIRRYRMRLRKLLNLIKDEKFVESDSEIINVLEKNLKDINELLTKTPKTGEIEDGIRLDTTGALHFSETQVDKITTALLDTQGSIFSLIIEINRSNRE